MSALAIIHTLAFVGVTILIQQNFVGMGTGVDRAAVIALAGAIPIVHLLLADWFSRGFSPRFVTVVAVILFAGRIAVKMHIIVNLYILPINLRIMNFQIHMRALVSALTDAAAKDVRFTFLRLLRRPRIIPVLSAIRARMVRHCIVAVRMSIRIHIAILIRITVGPGFLIYMRARIPAIAAHAILKIMGFALLRLLRRPRILPPHATIRAAMPRHLIVAECMAIRIHIAILISVTVGPGFLIYMCTRIPAPIADAAHKIMRFTLHRLLRRPRIIPVLSAIRAIMTRHRIVTGRMSVRIDIAIPLIITIGPAILIFMCAQVLIPAEIAYVVFKIMGFTLHRLLRRPRIIPRHAAIQAVMHRHLVVTERVSVRIDIAVFLVITMDPAISICMCTRVPISAVLTDAIY